MALTGSSPDDARPQKFAFTRGIDFIGDQTLTDPDLASGNTKVVFLTCLPTLDIGHSVTSTLRRVVLRGPPGDRDWHHAFKP